jgi:hypothetical protein
MRCFLLFSLPLFAVALPGYSVRLTPGAPIPKDRQGAPMSFPAVKGTTWVYQYSGLRELTETETVISVTRNGRSFHIALEVERKKTQSDVAASETWKKYVRVSAAGLHATYSPSCKDDDYICFLKLPIERGMDWNTQIYDDAVNTHSFADTEKIDTPAGSYMSYRINVVTRAAGYPVVVRTTEWYAPGVGLVKRSMYGQEVVLLSFARGEE